ncbi:MFS domain-containing protein [Heracleum sosnowskyi]|uniref:MFS domain-containing protein n=1 Tax=Heracleum sosnowskyi TaxID=360622 RepID=A0AAD8NEZ7_9APIA|nr:MFS domain-containing protein [Heracleum sosnowskyi]
MKAETLTLVLVNLAGIMERADESLLPGVYKEVGQALHTDPTGLGSLTLYRSMVQSLCFPLAAYLSLRYNRAHVIAYGAFLWAAATFLVAFSSSFFQVALSRALNGIGLAIVGPAIQSLVADSTDDHSRGMAFGWLQLTSNLGSIIGGLFSVMLAPTTFMGIPGWRISFHLVGIISVFVGILVRFFANDPHYSNGGSKSTTDISNKTLWSEVKDLTREAKSVMKIQSFQIIVAQGVTGSFPWSALSFSAMWLELAGFSHKITGFIIAMFVVGSSLGGLFGGFFISWNGPATNNPIFAEIVPEKSRTTIYALDRSFETVLSSFAPPIVGILAQHVYGYEPVPEGSENIATDRENAESLGKALYTAIGIPMGLCCLIYTFLYFTYPRDRERAQMDVLIDSELQEIVFDSSSESKQYTEVRSSESKEHYPDGTNAGQIAPLDESEEKLLLYRQLTFSNLVNL